LAVIIKKSGLNVAPDAIEILRWGGLSYYHAGRGGIVSGGICQIGMEKKSRSTRIHPRSIFIRTAPSLRRESEIQKVCQDQILLGCPRDDLWKLIVLESKLDPDSAQPE
jgi:hypothetical protein